MSIDIRKPVVPSTVSAGDVPEGLCPFCWHDTAGRVRHRCAGLLAAVAEARRAPVVHFDFSGGAR